MANLFGKDYKSPRVAAPNPVGVDNLDDDESNASPIKFDDIKLEDDNGNFMMNSVN